MHVWWPREFQVASAVSAGKHRLSSVIASCCCRCWLASAHWLEMNSVVVQTNELCHHFNHVTSLLSFCSPKSKSLPSSLVMPSASSCSLSTASSLSRLRKLFLSRGSQRMQTDGVTSWCKNPRAGGSVHLRSLADGIGHRRIEHSSSPIAKAHLRASNGLPVLYG